MRELARRYERQPVVRALVQLVPFGIGSAFDTALTTRLENRRRDRARSFFDELAAGSVELSPELIKSEDFLHCYFITLRAALDSHRREKIRLMARLLRSSASGGEVRDIDDYEELLGTLDDLSYRELQVLARLDHYSAPDADPSHEDQIRNRRAFKAALVEQLGIADDEVPAILARLQRSGLFAVATTAVTDDGSFSISNTAALGFGELSPRYYRLRELVGELAEDSNRA
jgi:hypothetical protein